MKSSVLTVLVVATAAGGGAVWAAGGGTWIPADEVVEVEVEPSEYETAMAEGDENALQAAGEAASPATILKLINISIRAYERAAKADPKAAEPHWRAGNVIYGFFLDCDPNNYALCDPENHTLFQRVLDHWHAFETKAPLDPRLTAILFDRAILHTKLATDDDLRAAIADYEALLDRSVEIDLDSATILGNLAESHMMLGDLDEAIERYREAVLAPGSRKTSIFYGLAVAYDRDDQGAKAKEIFAAHGEGPFKEWLQELEPGGGTFYVPAGEEYYYIALGYESLGNDSRAIQMWKAFLDSPAHPIYRPRAREHVNKLKAKK